MSYKEKHQPDNYVNEPMAVYIAQSKNSMISGLFAGNARQFQSASDFDVLQLTRNGLKKSLLLSLAKKISLTLQELADIMHITERSLQRYDDDAIFKTVYAE